MSICLELHRPAVIFSILKKEASNATEEGSTTEVQEKSDNLTIGWEKAINLLKLNLISKLVRRGYTFNSALDLIKENRLLYHSLLGELFKEIIEEARGDDPCCISITNPGT